MVKNCEFEFVSSESIASLFRFGGRGSGESKEGVGSASSSDSGTRSTLLSRLLLQNMKIFRFQAG